jgi:hypothetical protein
MFHTAINRKNKKIIIKKIPNVSAYYIRFMNVMHSKAAIDIIHKNKTGKG